LRVGRREAKSLKSGALQGKRKKGAGRKAKPENNLFDKTDPGVPRHGWRQGKKNGPVPADDLGCFTISVEGKHAETAGEEV